MFFSFVPFLSGFDLTVPVVVVSFLLPLFRYTEYKMISLLIQHKINKYKHLVRKNMDVNEHERLSKITRRHKLK